MDDFERQLNEIHDRVLGKALTEEEQNNYPRSVMYQPTPSQSKPH